MTILNRTQTFNGPSPKDFKFRGLGNIDYMVGNDFLALGYNALKDTIDKHVFIVLDAGVINDLGGLVGTVDIDTNYGISVKFKTFTFGSAARKANRRRLTEIRDFQTVPILSYFQNLSKMLERWMLHNFPNF